MYFEIRPARAEEAEKITEFYYDVIDLLHERGTGVKWEKDVYPTRNDLRNAVKNGEMHIGISDKRIVCAFRMTGNVESYKGLPWPTEASEEEIRVLHLLTVHPDLKGMGFAKKMVAYAADLSRKEGCKVIRLDVLKGNTAAEKLYLKCGFQFVTEQKIFYEDTGLAEFRMFELIL